MKRRARWPLIVSRLYKQGKKLSARSDSLIMSIVDQVRRVPIQKAAEALIVSAKRYLAFWTGWVTDNTLRADDTSLAVQLTVSVPEHSSHTISAHLFPPKSILGRQAVWLYEHYLPGTIWVSRHDWNSHSLFEWAEWVSPQEGVRWPFLSAVCAQRHSRAYYFLTSKLHFVKCKGAPNAKCIILNCFSPRQQKLPVKLAHYEFRRCWKAKATLQNQLNMATYQLWHLAFPKPKTKLSAKSNANHWIPYPA